MFGGFDKRSQCVRPTTKSKIWNVFITLNDDCCSPLHKQWNVFLWIALFYGCLSLRTNSAAASTSLANPYWQSNLFKRHRKHCPSMHEVPSNIGRYRIRYATRLKCTRMYRWHVLWNIEQHRQHIMSYFPPILQSPAAFFQHVQPYKCFMQNVAKTTRWTQSMIKSIRTQRRPCNTTYLKLLRTTVPRAFGADHS